MRYMHNVVYLNAIEIVITNIYLGTVNTGHSQKMRFDSSLLVRCISNFHIYISIVHSLLTLILAQNKDINFFIDLILDLNFLSMSPEVFGLFAQAHMDI